MIRRARLLAVLGILLGGTIGVLASTQTWIDVTLADGAGESLPVAGAAAVPVLTPLSLAALALGAALSIVGPVLRYAFAVIAALIGGVLAVLSAQVAVAVPVGALASTVTAATGISGVETIAGLVVTAAVTAWPAVTAVGGVLVAAAGVFTLVTARRWSGGADRKYRTGTRAVDGPAGSRPHDAVDSWDDLSRGDDPTA